MGNGSGLGIETDERESLAQDYDGAQEPRRGRHAPGLLRGTQGFPQGDRGCLSSFDGPNLHRSQGPNSVRFVAWADESRS